MKNPVAGIILFVIALLLLAGIFFMSMPRRRGKKDKEVA